MRSFNIKRKVKWKKERRKERERRERETHASSEEHGEKVIANVSVLEKMKYTCPKGK